MGDALASSVDAALTDEQLAWYRLLHVALLV